MLTLMEFSAKKILPQDIKSILQFIKGSTSAQPFQCDQCNS